jgi:hypothetical protein
LLDGEGGSASGTLRCDLHSQQGSCRDSKASQENTYSATIGATLWAALTR